MSDQSPVRRHPEICGGKLTFGGTRVMVDSLVEYIAGGATLEEWLVDYPSVPREQAVATLHRMLRLLDEATPVTVASEPSTPDEEETPP